MKTPQGTPESTWDQSVRTQGHSGQQLSSFCPTANANDLSKASKGPRAHPRMVEEEENWIRKQAMKKVLPVIT